MHISRFALFLFAALCCLFMCSPAQAQQAYGYATITFDESTDTATGYASTEVDYETAYYYDAEVQAHIEDENEMYSAPVRLPGIRRPIPSST